MKTRKGFTLIELIIIIVTVSIGLGALLTALASVVQNSVRPNVMQIASDLAEQELERVSGKRFSQVINESGTFAAPLNNYAWQITVSAVPVALATDPGMAQYKQVTVSVSNTYIGSVTVKTVVTNN